MSDKLWLDEASDISPDEFDAVMRIPQRERKLEAENERLRAAANALIDFNNGPREAKRLDIHQRLLVRLARAMENTND